MTDKVFQLLQIFSIERPVWTAEQIAVELDVGISTAYRLLGKLLSAGLVDSITHGRYALGPAIIQLDRQIQLTDPLIQAAEATMRDLITMAPAGSALLLCRAFREEVLCIHQVTNDVTVHLSYERGRPRPLLRGATSKSILAFMPPRILRKVYDGNVAEIADSGMGGSWPEFRKTMRELRKPGFVLARGEVDPGRVGIAAPILDGDRNPLGSLSYVLDETQADERTINRLSSMIQAGAREIRLAVGASASGDEGQGAAS